MGNAAIEARGLTKVSGGRKVVDRLDLAVAPGEVLALLGPRGAGKTTAIRMLLGLTRPTAGYARLLGGPVGAGALRQVGAIVGEPFFYPWLSGRRNLEVLLHGRAGRSEVDLALETVGLLDAARVRVKGYSPELRRRLGLALAICGAPAALVLDEPARGLGRSGAREVASLIGRAAAAGSAVLLSSDVLDEVVRACHRAAVLSKGRIVAEGSLDELGGDVLCLSVVVPPEQHDLALSVLAPLSVRADGPDGFLVHAGSGREVSRRLAEAGIFPDAMTRRSSALEDRFLSL